jgi:hypothetical protein
VGKGRGECMPGLGSGMVGVAECLSFVQSGSGLVPDTCAVLESSVSRHKHTHRCILPPNTPAPADLFLVLSLNPRCMSPGVGTLR